MNQKTTLLVGVILFAVLGIILLIYLNIFFMRVFTKNFIISKHTTLVSEQSMMNGIPTIYKSSFYGISFSYPSEWEVVDIAPFVRLQTSLEKPVLGLNPKNRNQNNLGPLIYLVLWDNPSNLSTAAYQQQYGKQFTYDNCGSYRCNQVVLIPLNNKLLELQGIATPDATKYLSREKEIFQQILSTLKAD